MWHGCGDYSVEKFLEGKGPRARELFERFVGLIAACGPFDTAPAKTRVAFMARVRFAAVLRLSNRGMTVSFGLPRRLEHPRISRIEDYGSGWYGHFVRVTSSEEMDDGCGSRIPKWASNVAFRKITHNEMKRRQLGVTAVAIEQRYATQRSHETNSCW